MKETFENIVRDSIFDNVNVHDPEEGLTGVGDATKVILAAHKAEIVDVQNEWSEAITRAHIESKADKAAAVRDLLTKLELYLEPDVDPAWTGGKTGDEYWQAVGFSKGRKDQAATVRRFIERETAAANTQQSDHEHDTTDFSNGVNIFDTWGCSICLKRGIITPMPIPEANRHE